MNKQQQFGYSIIELMIVILVLAIVSSIALPSYRLFIANTQIRTTAESIRNGLQTARGEAVKRNATVRFTLANNTSWTVGCLPVIANCPANIQSKAAREGSASTVTVVITGTNAIDFTSLGTVTSVAGQLSQVNVDSSSIPSTQSGDLRIRVGAGGNVRMCDPNVATVTDPRYCS